MEAEFIKQVEDFLDQSGLSATALGRLALKQPAFVHSLRDGRSPSLRTCERVLKFMREYENKAA